MRKGLLAAYPPSIQFIFTILTMLTCNLLFTFVGIAVGVAVFNIPPDQVAGILSGEDATGHLNFLRYTQTLSHLSLFLIPALFLGMVFSKNFGDYYSFKSSIGGKWFVVTLLVMLTIIPFINLLNSLNHMIVFPDSLYWLELRLRASEDAAAYLTNTLINVDHIGGMFFNLFMIAILPAIGEELVFRGVFQDIFSRWTRNIHAGIIISAFLFSVMHMRFYGLFPRWLLGILFGYLLVWSKSMWLPIFAHFVYNALAVVISFLIHKGCFAEEVSDYGATWSDIPVTILTAVLCLFMLWKMRQKRRVHNFA